MVVADAGRPLARAALAMLAVTRSAISGRSTAIGRVVIEDLPTRCAGAGVAGASYGVAPSAQPPGSGLAGGR
jgi:hypothetical protein